MMEWCLYDKPIKEFSIDNSYNHGLRVSCGVCENNDGDIIGRFLFKDTETGDEYRESIALGWVEESKREWFAQVFSSQLSRAIHLSKTNQFSRTKKAFNSFQKAVRG